MIKITKKEFNTICVIYIAQFVLSMEENSRLYNDTRR